MDGNIMLHPFFEKMVRSFSEKDDNRVSINKPTFYDNGWVSSTNSHKMLWFMDINYKNRDDVHIFSKGQGVNALQIMEKYSSIYEHNEKPIGKIDLRDIIQVLSSIRKEPEYEEKYTECGQCDGYGVIECDCCGHESKCSDCGGYGELVVGKFETGHYRYPEGKLIKISDNFFTLKEFEEIVNNMSLIDVHELDVYFTNDNMKSLFGLPNERIFILLMGTMTTKEDGHYIIHIKPLP
jgi:hypothetical protein